VIIADQPSPPDRRRQLTPWLAALSALALGGGAAVMYARAGLTLSHYDAKAHLVVARRVIDSLTPGWVQLGAVWLPLPHLLNLLPAQSDVCYRTGAFAVALSVVSFAVLASACTRLILDATGSSLAAMSGLSVVALNPDLLYLQATPMTEPLFLGLSALAVLAVGRWVDADGARGSARAGLLLALACLTRYEAWPLTVAAVAIAGLGLWRRGVERRQALRRTIALAGYPGAAVLAFLLQSRLSVGRWFVTDGFYVIDNPDMGRAFKTAGSIWWASHHLNGYGVLLCAVAGAAAMLVGGLRDRRRASSLVTLALAASAALPWYAFYIGHPFRFRYMVPLVPAVAVWAGIGVGLTGRFKAVAAAALIALVVVETRPFDLAAPMVQEAQLDRQHSLQRRAMTAYLRDHWRREKILVSLASLSHYVQELSGIGVRIRDVVHEGNGDLWTAAIDSPGAHVGWILIDQLSEGGDVLAERSREYPDFLNGFEPVASGGGVVLYRRAGKTAGDAPAASPRPGTGLAQNLKFTVAR
jgi:hypothetical protein